MSLSRAPSRSSASALLVVLALLWSSASGLRSQVRDEPAPQAPPAIDVSKLPLDLHRIERQLRQTAEREERDGDGLRIRYFVDVFGRAPQIELFTPGENLSSGPVPWGAPTHQQMLEVMTPKEFRSPTMDFAAFMRWLQDKAKK
jgi:hypothetical protein